MTTTYHQLRALLEAIYEGRDQLLLGLATSTVNELLAAGAPLIDHVSELTSGNVAEHEVAKRLGIPSFDQWIVGEGKDEIRLIVNEASRTFSVSSSLLTKRAKARYYELYPVMRPLMGRPPDPERFVLARLIELCVKHGLEGAKQELGIDQEAGHGKEEKPAKRRAVAA